MSAARQALLIALASIAAALFCAWGPFHNSDGWHHLAVGRWIAENASVPLTDHWTYSSFGLPWIPHEWLFQATLYAICSVSGFTGIAIFRMTLIAATLFFAGATARTLHAKASLTVPLLLLAAYAASYRFIDRPHLMTFLLTAIVIFLMERWLASAAAVPASATESGAARPLRAAILDTARSAASLWLLIPLFWIWGNCHAGVVYGWIILGIYSLSHLKECGFALHSRRVWVFVIPVTIALLATLCGPTGVDTVLYPYLTLKKLKDAGLDVLEFQSTELHGAGFQFYIAIAIVATWLLLGALRLASLREVLLILFIGALAIRWERERAYLFLAALPFICIRATTLLDWLSSRIPRPRTLRFAVLGGLWILVALAAGRRLPYVDWDLRNIHYTQPRGAVDFALKRNLPGNVFSVVGYSGYLEWRSPQTKVFFDPRLDLLPASVLKDLITIMRAEPEASGILERYGTEWLLLDYDETGSYIRKNGAIDFSRSLIGKLFSDPRWVCVYRDDVSIIYMRSDLHAAKYADLRTWSLVSPAATDKDLPTSGSALAQAISELQELAAAQPDCSRCKRQLAMAYLNDGQTTEAAHTFGRLLDTKWPKEDDYYSYAYALDELGMTPKSLAVTEEGLKHFETSTKLLELSAIALAKTGRLQEAIQVLEKAERIGPTDPIRTQNLAHMRRNLGTAPARQ